MTYKAISRPSFTMLIPFLFFLPHLRGKSREKRKAEKKKKTSQQSKQTKEKKQRERERGKRKQELCYIDRCCGASSSSYMASGVSSLGEAASEGKNDATSGEGGGRKPAVR